MRVVKGSGKAISYLTPPRILLALVTAWLRRGRWFDDQVYLLSWWRCSNKLWRHDICGSKLLPLQFPLKVRSPTFSKLAPEKSIQCASSGVGSGFQMYSILVLSITLMRKMLCFREERYMRQRQTEFETGLKAGLDFHLQMRWRCTQRILGSLSSLFLLFVLS